MIVMSELIYELSDSELDAIAGGQVNVVGNFTATTASNTTAGASVANSIGSTATANAASNTTITAG